MSIRRLTAQRLAETHRFRTRLRARMSERHVTQAALARNIGVTQTMVGYWVQGRYLPSIEMADRLADSLFDQGLLDIVRVATTARCLVCPRTFRRDTTRRLYCSVACRRDYHKGVRGAPSTDPRQAAIDSFCRSCEPSLICRTASCELRAFSPLFLLERRSA